MQSSSGSVAELGYTNDASHTKSFHRVGQNSVQLYFARKSTAGTSLNLDFPSFVYVPPCCDVVRMLLSTRASKSKPIESHNPLAHSPKIKTPIAMQCMEEFLCISSSYVVRVRASVGGAGASLYRCRFLMLSGCERGRFSRYSLPLSLHHWRTIIEAAHVC